MGRLGLLGGVFRHGPRLLQRAFYRLFDLLLYLLALLLRARPRRGTRGHAGRAPQLFLGQHANDGEHDEQADDAEEGAHGVSNRGRSRIFTDVLVRPDCGVHEKHYVTVGTALLWTLSAGLGEKFTPEVREAWTAAYGLLADVMQFGALEAERIKRHQEQDAAIYAE
jgi:hypothetical protein